MLIYQLNIKQMCVIYEKLVNITLWLENFMSNKIFYDIRKLAHYW